MGNKRQCAGESLTVIVNTFKRLDLLKNSVQHYSACSVVSRVHVNWAESITPPNVDKCKCCDTEVTFALPLLTHNDSSLNTRFLPIPGTPDTLPQSPPHRVMSTYEYAACMFIHRGLSRGHIHCSFCHVRRAPFCPFACRAWAQLVRTKQVPTVRSGACCLNRRCNMSHSTCTCTCSPLHYMTVD